MLKYESVNRRLGLDGVLPASSARSGGAEIVGKLAAGGVVLVLEAFFLTGCEAVEFQNAADMSNIYMGVSKNRGTPKWMVYNGTPY